MPDYNVEWNGTYDTAGPTQAALQAWEDMQRSGSIANVFEVSDDMDMTVRVDLDDIQDSPAVWVPSLDKIADLAQHMAEEMWDMTEIVEMIRHPFRYADEYSKMVADRAFDEVAKEPEELEVTGGTEVSSLRVHFIPEKWVNDHAVEVEVDWSQFHWFVSADTARAVERCLDERKSDWDFIKDDELTPPWIKDWSGPFTIELTSEGHEFEVSEFWPDGCKHCATDEAYHA